MSQRDLTKGYATVGVGGGKLVFSHRSEDMGEETEEGTLKYDLYGLEKTLADLLERAKTISDNISANLFGDVVGSLPVREIEPKDPPCAASLALTIKNCATTARLLHDQMDNLEKARSRIGVFV